MRSRICLMALLAVALPGCAVATGSPVGLDGRTLGSDPPTVTPPPTTPPPLPNLPPTCRPPGVQIMIGPTDGATGLRSVLVWLQNCGTRPYTVDGYPSLRILDRAGHPMPEIKVYQGLSHVWFDPFYNDPPRPITIRPGHHITAEIEWRLLVTRSDVDATVGAIFELAPRPGEPVHRLVNDGNIDVGNTGAVAVSAWTTRDAPYTPPTTEAPPPPPPLP